jgi:hypothetical protein
MSDREFENYLSLVSGLLRLEGQQRRAIADELRSHLEDRLDELMAQGLSKDDAIQQALAEFGDAAGLAGQFVSIARNRKRRWLMRAMTFSAAAIFLLAAALAIVWPGRNAAPGVANLTAQDPAAAAPQVPGLPGAPVTGEPSLEDKLNLRLDANFSEVPLGDVLTYIRDATGIQFVVRTKKLEEAAVTPDVPVNAKLKQVRVSTLLDLLLADLELTYVERDDLIFITTPEDAEATLVVRVYDCRDLLSMDAPPGADKFIGPPPAKEMRGGMFAIEDPANGIANSGPPAGPPSAGGMGGIGGFMGGGGSGLARPVSEHDVRAERLMDILTTNVDTDSWQETGGPGSISEYNGLIVVTQTAQTHKKVERVLDMLRQAAGLEASKAGKVVR